MIGVQYKANIIYVLLFRSEIQKKTTHMNWIIKKTTVIRNDNSIEFEAQCTHRNWQSFSIVRSALIDT